MATLVPIPYSTTGWNTQLDANIAAVNTDVETRAVDANTVHNSGAETVAGVKTFTSAPVVPDAAWSIAKTNGLQAALDAKQTSYLRTTTSVTTVNLAPGAQAAITIPVGNEYTLSKLTVDKAARIRVYATIAQRTADASRGAVVPTGDHGVMFEYTSSGSEPYTIAPGVPCSNFESSINAPILIDNTGATTQAITVTFTYKRME
jgi:hypothetical protein